MQSLEKKHINTELVIDLVQGALEEDGYKTKRYSDSRKYETSSYDCIIVKGADGNYYELTVSELTDVRNPYTNELYRAEDKFNSI